jgi:hypothetical protein
MKHSLIFLVLLVILSGNTHAQSPDLPQVGSQGCAQQEVTDYLWARKALLNAGRTLVSYIEDERLTPSGAVVISSVLGHAIYLLPYPDCLEDLQRETLVSVLAMNQMYACLDLRTQACLDNVKGFLDDVSAARDPILESVYAQVGIEEQSKEFQTILPPNWDPESWLVPQIAPTPSES